MIYHDLLRALYGQQSPYDGCDLTKQDHGYPHTNLCNSLVRVLFAEAPPCFVLECGSMLGGSAIRMAQLIKEQELSASVICVDPFTGDVNMWAWEQELAHRNQWRFLRLEKGRPTIYDRFLANCVAAHCNDIILPINTTSTVGMKLLKRLYSERRINELPNYLYLDSAHEPRETLLELHLAWDLLVDGGILFGDDWSWDSVRHDVLQFASEAIDTIDLRFAEQIAAKLPGSVLQDGILLYEGQWVMRKTSA